MLSDLYLIYTRNSLIVTVFAELIAATLFGYYFILRTKKVYCKLYWRGFLLIAIAISVTLIQKLFLFGSWRFNMLKLPLLCAGFVLVILGARKQVNERKLSGEDHG